VTEPLTAKLFLSWARCDRRLKEELIRRLTPHLAILRGVRIEWWEDSLLAIGEEFQPAIKDELGRCHYGVLLLSPDYFTRPFILEHELPRFAGPAADKRALPVALRSLQLDGSRELHGIERQVIFQYGQKAFSELAGDAKRDAFASELATRIRLRILGDQPG
jgi:hypothetical protein